MANWALAVTVIILLQTIVGILGNFSVLYHYILLHLSGCRVNSTDLILKHLTVANLLVIFSKGVPQTMADLGWEHLLSDLECRLLFYLHRVGRDVAIGTTCLLSVCQMIIISPRTSGWAQFKVHAAKYMGTASVLGWVLNMLLNVMVLLYMTSREGGRNITRKREYHYCHSVTPSHTAQSVYVVLLVFHNGFCLGLMLWASGSLVFFLFRHKQRLQYIHSHHRPPRPSPETRAVQGVVVLVTFFVSFWGLSMLFHICLVVLSSPSWWLEDASTLITAGFPTVSPYILMGRDPRVSPLCLPTRTGALSH